MLRVTVKIALFPSRVDILLILILPVWGPTFVFSIKITQSWFEFDGGFPREAKLPLATADVILPFCNAPPLRGLYHLIEKVSSEFPKFIELELLAFGV